MDGQDANDTNSKPKQISANVKARIERNRQKALLLRQSRLVEKLGRNKNGDVNSNTGYGTKIIDSGGGFFIEEDENTREKKKVKRVEEPAPDLTGEKIACDICGKCFLDSYLLKTFDQPSCDSCKDMDETHKLITKTEAKSKFQLTDVDLEKREPVLRYISRKNPHNQRWGEMKLYLQLQVEKRAVEVHGSLDKVEEVRVEKNIKKEVARKKKYQKKMDALRKEVRSSLYTKDTSAHVHEFGPEICKEHEEDLWMKICQTCGHEMNFEKM